MSHFSGRQFSLLLEGPLAKKRITQNYRDWKDLHFRLVDSSPINLDIGVIADCSGEFLMYGVARDFELIKKRKASRKMTLNSYFSFGLALDLVPVDYKRQGCLVYPRTICTNKGAIYVSPRVSEKYIEEAIPVILDKAREVFVLKSREYQRLYANQQDNQAARFIWNNLNSLVPN